MKSAFGKDIFRSITKSKKRFCAIMVITALGVAMLSGIKAACIDMRKTADVFFDNQELFDIQVLSTLGLTEEDVEALSQMPDVAWAEGGFSKSVYTQTDEVRMNASIQTLSSNGRNKPYLLEGRLPEKSGEVAVTSKYCLGSGQAIGDKIRVEETEEGEEASLLRNEFIITGIVLDPMEVSGNDSTTAFRSNSVEGSRFFILPEDAENEIYTAVYLSLTNTAGLVCYSTEYENRVSQMTDAIEAQIRKQREQARYDEIYQEAASKIADAEEEMTEEFQKADGEIADADNEILDNEEKLAEGRSELEKGEKELKEKEKEAAQKIADARIQLQEGERQLEEGEQQWSAGTVELAEGEKQLNAAKEEYDKGKEEAVSQFENAEKDLEKAKNQVGTAQQTLNQQQEAVIAQFGAMWPAEAWNALVDGATAQYVQVLNKSLSEEAVWGNLASQWEAFLAMFPPEILQQPEISQGLNNLPQLAMGIGKTNASVQQISYQEDELMKQKDMAFGKLEEGAAAIRENEEKLRLAREEVMAGRAKLDESRAQLESGKIELDKQEAEAKTAIEEAKQELLDARKELLDGEEKLQEGKQELAEQKQEYEEKKEEAKKEIADAKEELADIDVTTWYILDRTSLDSYSGLNSDTDAIEAVGTVFPILFFIVAVLISLTTITRMVEEDRGLIGTYKALGMKDGAIYGKYLCYAFTACLFGGILGDICGFIFLPKFVWLIFSRMYALPEFLLSFDMLYGIGGVILFMIGIVGATALACRNELELLPAVLMRPKAPRAGTRVVFERIPFFWNRLKFLNKVTVRNLFRYKKRMFMTLIGIMGCTALILCGFAIKDSVTELMPKQYGDIYQYDLITVFEPDDAKKMEEQAKKDKSIKEFIMIQTESLKIKNSDGREESVQLMVVPGDERLEDYIHLVDGKEGKIPLTDESIVITKNAAELLKLEKGMEAYLQNSDLQQVTVTVSEVTQNFLGNYIYMTSDMYESLFTEYKANGILALFSEECENQIGYADNLAKQENVFSAVATASLRKDFEKNFTIINAVVYLITAMAAGLAFVVLFTLATTNISERQRELSTIKVLGFYDPEVHKYVNKETVILTVIGILLGLPLGRVLGGYLTEILKMPSIYFAVTIKPISYLITATAAFCFALVVEIFTNRTLDHIDMVGALKSVE